MWRERNQTMRLRRTICQGIVHCGACICLLALSMAGTVALGREADPFLSSDARGDNGDGTPLGWSHGSARGRFEFRVDTDVFHSAAAQEPLARHETASREGRMGPFLSFSLFVAFLPVPTLRGIRWKPPVRANTLQRGIRSVVAAQPIRNRQECGDASSDGLQFRTRMGARRGPLCCRAKGGGWTSL